MPVTVSVPTLPSANWETYADRAAWLAARQSGIGSSDAAAIFGLSPWSTPFTLFHEKLGLADLPDAAREAAEWGTLLEPLLAERYSRVTNRPVIDPGRFMLERHREHAHLIASVDRLIEDPERGLGILELKTTSRYRKSDWATEPPINYQIQVQHQLAVTGIAWAAMAVLIGGQEFFYTDVERNEPFIETLLEVEHRFWQAIEQREPPPADGSSATRALLKVLFPREEKGLTVTLPPVASEWDARRTEAITQLDHWEAVRDEAENSIKAAMGEAEIGIVDFATRYSWKASNRKGYEVKPSVVRALRRISV
jgi:putative phage-type endonuclease